jgi:predicted aspartyl protease
MGRFRVFVFASAAALAAGLAPLAAPSANDDVAAITARHAAYAGQPPGLVLTYRYVPKATPAPSAAPSAGASDSSRTLTKYRRGGLYRDVVERSGISTQDGFTGRAFWSSNANGYTVVNYENAARRMLTENLVDADLLANVPAVSRGVQTIGGITADVVRFTPDSGIAADVAFDHTTGAYVQITYDPDNRYERSVLRIDGYSEVAPGVRVPNGFHSGEFGAWSLVEKAGRPVTNDDLRGPVPSAAWTFNSTDADPIELAEHQTPYAFMPRGQAVHVHAAIDGHVGTFLLDSGASSIVLYRPFADKLQLAYLGRTSFSGVNGRGMAARYARIGAIDVGKNSLKNVVVTVAGGQYADGIDGILGYDFLAAALVDIDLAHRTMRILDATTMEPAVGPGAYAFRVNLATLQPEIALKAGNASTRAIFDTGDDFLAVLSDDLKSSGRIVALNDTIAVGGDSYEYQISFYGVDGPGNVPARCSRLNQIEIGPYRYQNVETCFASASVFGRDGGLIGFDFLKHFNWTFDYPESKLVLTPNGK